MSNDGPIAAIDGGQKRRLTDAEVTARWDRELHGESTGVDMVALHADHLQAREDVKRLLEFMEAASDDGEVDWEQWAILKAGLGS